MRALVCHELSEDIGVLRLDEVASSEPGPGEVKVRLRAASVNFPDLLMIQGKYQLKPPLPFSPGMEAAGDIIELGSGVEGWSLGERVVVGMRYGAYAEEAITPAERLRRFPEHWDYAKGSAFRAAYMTAYVALHERAQLREGETLLVHGAAGGVGLTAVEIGKLLGARVIATSASDEKLKVVKTRGADEVVNYARGFRERVKELTDGRGADVIYDPIGGDVFDESTRCIAWGGRLLVIGFTSGRIPTVRANIPLIKGFSVVGVRAGEYGRRNPKRGLECLEAIERLAAERKIEPHVCAEFPIERGVEAMRMLADRKVVGKVVITM